jgi:tetratricopeptide (TPR) repeat protein
LVEFPLLRLLLHTFWFRLAVFVMGLLVLLGALAIPRVWRTTPPGFLPEVKLRLLSFVKVWSLKRTARRCEAEGRSADALTAWTTAWGNNRGDLESLRNMLRLFAQTEPTGRSAELPFQAGQWLMRLGGTNDLDLGLISSAWINYGLGGQVWGLLGPRNAPLPPDLERLHLIALCQAGQGAEFVRRFATNSAAPIRPLQIPPQPPAGAVPASGTTARLTDRFDLVQAAFLSAWGEGTEKGIALAHLVAAQQQPATRSWAFHLEFLVREQRNDVQACARILESLRATGEKPIILNTAYWGLLARLDQADAARALATAETLPPRDPFESYRLIRTYAGLDLWEESDRLTKAFEMPPAWRAEIEVVRAQWLMRNRKFEDLRQLAERLGAAKETADLLGGYPKFMEAIAQASQGETNAASAGFAQAASNGIPDPVLALGAAETMLQAGAPGPAAVLIKKHCITQASNPDFWHFLVRCSDVLFDENTLWEAMTHLKALLPDDPIVENNYAVALTIRREQPEEIIRHTFIVLQKAPDNPTVILNHACALVLNGRLAEARTLLDRVSPNTLSPRDRAQYHIIHYEIHIRGGNRVLADEHRGQIDRDQLWPSQRTWLEASIAATPNPANPPANR